MAPSGAYVRGTTVAGGACLCTRYDVRFGEFPREAREFGAYVRFSMYNTHDGPVEGARAAGGGGRQGLPMYDVRSGEVPALARECGAYCRDAGCKGSVA